MSLSVFVGVTFFSWDFVSIYCGCLGASPVGLSESFCRAEVLRRCAAGARVWPAVVVGGRPQQQRLLECVLDVLAGLLHAGLGLVLLALAFGVPIASDLAECLLGFARGVLSGILDFIGDSHGGVPSVVVGRELRMTVAPCAPRSARTWK